MLAGMDSNGRNRKPPRGPAPQRSVWTIIGIVLAVVLGIGGLAVVGFAVLLYVGMSHYASNK
jgi:hypothetical protein